MEAYNRVMMDDKVSKNIVEDLKRHLPPGGFQSKLHDKCLRFFDLKILSMSFDDIFHKDFL